MHNKNCLRGGKWGGKEGFWGGSSHPMVAPLRTKQKGGDV